MIPILFDKSETAFNTNGLGRLSDCISCTVTQERNGIFECEFEYPITGAHYEEIEEGRIIYVTHDESGEPQPFDIYSHTKPINGIVTFYAHHISYRLGEITVKPFSASSIAGAMAAIPGKSVNTNPFDFWTNKSTTGTYKIDVPTSCRALLCGAEGSLLDVYGTGEYEFDKFDVKLYLHRGTDSGVQIRYGKNLVDLTDEVDYQNTYTAVVPYWYGTTNDGDTEESTLVTLPEWAISSGHSSYTGRVVLVPMDLSGEWQEAPDVNALRTRATAMLADSEAWLPSQNITVDFVALWQTEEYAQYAPLQRVHLCDTVSVYYPELGIDGVQKKVVKTTYNVLLDRYDKLELGEPSNTLVGMINSELDKNLNALRAAMNNHDSTIQQVIEAAVQNATELITGGLGGHVVLKQNADGQPEEILIMNTDDINTATKVWRWNLGGLGYSNTGYSGTYGTAITMDGAIVADYITSGTMNANIIRAGIIADANNMNFWNLETGEFSLQPSAYTLYQNTNPANDWDTTEEKQAHVGYLWFYDGANNINLDVGLCDENGIQLQDENSVDIEGGFTILPDRVYRYAETFGWVIYDGIDSAVDGAVNAAIQGYDDTLTQTKIFNRLTRNGAVQGLYMYEGQIYLNASYIRSGILEVRKGSVTTFYADVNTGTVNIVADTFSLSSGDTIQSIADDAADAAESSAKAFATSSISTYDTGLNQSKVFNKLTNNGQTQGIYLSGGKIYINADYIATGILADAGENTIFNLSNGTFTMKKGSINLGSGAFVVTSAGALSCNNATITGGSLTIGSNFSVTSTGVITAKSGTVGPFTLSTTGFSYSKSGTVVSEIQPERIKLIKNGSESYDYCFYASEDEVRLHPLKNSSYSESIEVIASAGYFAVDYYYNSSDWVSAIQVIKDANWTEIKSPNPSVDAYIRGTTHSAGLFSTAAEVMVNSNGLTMTTGRQTTNHSGNLYLTAQGNAWYGVEASSSRKIKKYIKPLSDESIKAEKLYDVEVVQFQYKDGYLDDDDAMKGVTLPGFIVEDLEEIYPVAVQKDLDEPEESRYWSWSPYRIIPAMLKLIQDQHAEIEELKRRVQ